jgi:hypothetical protein
MFCSFANLCTSKFIKLILAAQGWQEEQEVQVRLHGGRAGRDPVSPRAAAVAAAEEGPADVRMVQVSPEQRYLKK